MVFLHNLFIPPIRKYALNQPLRSVAQLLIGLRDTGLLCLEGTLFIDASIESILLLQSLGEVTLVAGLRNIVDVVSFCLVSESHSLKKVYR